MLPASLCFLDAMKWVASNTPCHHNLLPHPWPRHTESTMMCRLPLKSFDKLIPPPALSFCFRYLCYSGEQLFNIFSILWGVLVSSHMTRRLFSFNFRKNKRITNQRANVWKYLHLPSSFPWFHYFLFLSWDEHEYLQQTERQRVCFIESWRGKATAHWKSTGQETSSDGGSREKRL